MDRGDGPLPCRRGTCCSPSRSPSGRTRCQAPRTDRSAKWRDGNVPARLARSSRCSRWPRGDGHFTRAAAKARRRQSARRSTSQRISRAQCWPIRCTIPCLAGSKPREAWRQLALGANDHHGLSALRAGFTARGSPNWKPWSCWPRATTEPGGSCSLELEARRARWHDLGDTSFAGIPAAASSQCTHQWETGQRECPGLSKRTQQAN